MVITGYSSAAKSGRPLTASRAAPVLPSGASKSVAAHAATCPPADAPITPIRSGRTPYSAARDRTSRMARSTSRSGAG